MRALVSFTSLTNRLQIVDELRTICSALRGDTPLSPAEE
jgi:hypothetical protein